MSTTIEITPERIADLLERAATRIEKYGHWKQDFSDWHDDPPRAKCCAAGAIRISAQWGLEGEPIEDHRFVGDAEAQLAEWLLAEGRINPFVPEDEDYAESDLQVIAAFNDADARTGDEVVAALRECAADVRAEAEAEAT